MTKLNYKIEQPEKEKTISNKTKLSMQGLVNSLLADKQPASSGTQPVQQQQGGWGRNN